MTDQNSQFFAILTAVGEAKQAKANALGVAWTFAQMGVGDANNTEPVPSRTQTKLINERRRAPLNQITVDPANSSVIIVEQVIPPDVGGWWIREIGLYDPDGDLVAVANCAPSYKPLLSQGTGKTQVVRLNIIVTSSANVQLKIDPAVVLTTRDYVDSSILTVLPRNKVAGAYTKVTINERGIVQQGSNPATLSGYGISDAYTKTQVDSAISAATSGKANKSTTLAGYGIGDAFTQTQTTAAINAAISALVNGAGSSLDTLKELADALGNDANFAATMTAALAGKAAKATTLGGYGIADAYTKTQTDSAISTATSGKANKATTLAGYGIADAYTQTQTTALINAALSALVNGAGSSLDTLKELADALGNDANFAATMTAALAGKAAKATTLGGYGIADTYTKAQTESAISTATSGKANKSTTLVGYGIADAFTQTQTTSAINAAVANKAEKSTTLAGYGIADAFTQTQTTAAINAAVANKVEKSTTLAGYGIADAFTKAQTTAVINASVENKAEKSTTLSGYGIADAFTQAQTTTAINAAVVNKADKSSTLLGYGISAATQQEAEQGSDTTKPMTALRVWQAIAAKVVAATELVAGVARFATLAEVKAGASGYLAVCPAYLLDGFGYNFGVNGYIKLPNWLGGLIIQWAYSDEGTGAGDFRYFPMPFPQIVYGAWLQLSSETSGGFGQNAGTILSVSDLARYQWTAGGQWGGGGKGWIFALGK